LPLILQDRSFASDGSIEYETDRLDIVYGARGDTVIVNGVIAPVAKVPPGTRDHPFMYHCHILEHEEAGLMGQYVCA
jgi:FtsP/CotA-like multicopper oxidase with cupredoxin domain